MEVTPFMQSLAEDLKARRGIADATARNTVRHLWTMNGRAPFKSLTFLRRYNEVANSFEPYSEGTRRAMMAAAVSALDGKPAYKKALAYWRDAMGAAVRNFVESRASGEKTEKEKAQWMDWADIEKVYNEYAARVASLPAGSLTAAQWNLLTDTLILGLYVLQPPRRAQDFLHMWVYKGPAKDLPTDKNWLVLSSSGKPQQFIYNIYKTSKKHGQQTEPVPEALADILGRYLSRHPSKAAPRARSHMMKLLVKQDGTAINQPNAITRLLNKVFGKRVSVNILRHSYLSSKYDLSEMQEDAEAMGHTIDTQREYLRRA